MGGNDEKKHTISIEIGRFNVILQERRLIRSVAH